MTIVRLYDETVRDFLQRQGRTNTSNIAARFGWDVRGSYRRLRMMERVGLIRRVGPCSTDTGKAQNWEAA